MVVGAYPGPHDVSSPRSVPSGDRAVATSLVFVPGAGRLFLGGSRLSCPSTRSDPARHGASSRSSRFEDATTYQSEGRFVMTSVLFQQLTGFGLFPRGSIRTTRWCPRRPVPVGRDRCRRSTFARSRRWTQSKLDATYVVLRALTGYPKEHGDGVLVEGVVTGCAADGELFPGDLDPSRSTERPSTAVGRPLARSRPRRPGRRSRSTSPSTASPRPCVCVREPCGGRSDRSSASR